MEKLNNNDLLNKKVMLRRNGSHNSIIEFVTAVLITLISDSRLFFCFILLFQQQRLLQVLCLTLRRLNQVQAGNQRNLSMYKPCNLSCLLRLPLPDSENFILFHA